MIGTPTYVDPTILYQVSYVDIYADFRYYLLRLSENVLIIMVLDLLALLVAAAVFPLVSDVGFDEYV